MNFQRFAGLCAVIWAAVCPGLAIAAGAIAIDTPTGDQWGWGISHDQSDADAIAMSKCGNNCQIVARFARHCAAFSSVDTGRSSIWGLGFAETEDEAKSIADRECRRRSGTSCSIRIWACHYITPGLSVASVSINEGDSGPATVTFTVTLATASNREVTVDYATSDGTATAGSDYTAASGTLTFAAGETTQTIDVTVTGDAIDEPDETFTVTLRDPVNATLATATATATIRDDDDTPGLSVASVSINEGDSGPATVTFTVTLATASNREVTVDYATSDGTATAGSDYTAASGTLTFAAGETTQTIDVTVTGDAIDEPDETFTVTLRDPVNATLATATATATIRDDDDTPGLSVASVSINEGDSGPATVTFTVTLATASNREVTVDYATSDGTATAGSDYTAASGTLTFAAGETTQTIDVTVTGDAIDEPDETFTVTLRDPVNATLATATATATIRDDDDTPGLSVASVSINEGDSGPATVTFTVTLATASNREVTVDYATSDGTATAGSDYTAASGTLTFAAGETTQTIDVTVTGDAIDEPDETFTVTLRDPVNATLATATATATIRDDDDTPGLSVASVSINEGDSGPATVTFTVTLATASNREVTVDYATSDGTATAGSDYTAASGTLTFAAGETTQTIDVTVTGDAIDEPDETFTVTLRDPVNATLATATATATIRDDDDTPGLSVASVSINEGDSGPATVTFTVTLATASNREVTVDYATSDGTATAGSDYTAASGTLTFAAGETTQTIDVTVTGDAIDEPDETFTVTLRDPVNATLATATATATIRDDDDTPGLSVASVSINEGDSGPATVTFTVTLATASNREVTVDYATSDGTATAGSDYTAASGTLTFAAGETTQTIDVTVTGDAIDEPDETFTVTLRDPVNATLATATATATIRDDDDTPGLSVASVSINEGDSGPATVTFTVTLATASNREVTVDYATSDGTATAGSDYTAASGTLTFAAGETTQTIDVTVTGDAIDEPDETFTVTLRDPVNATLATATATATIRDDDDTPGLSVASVSINEGDSGPATVTFTVTLATASNREVTVDYATSDGTATAGSDYTAASGTLTFAAGETTQTIDVTVTGDAIDEPDETFTVTLRDPVNATLATATATATIRDDDDTPGLSVASVSINEGDSGPATVTFTVTLATASNREVTVDYATSDGTATAGSDYTAASGTLTFAAGETTQTIDVTVTGDAIDEPDETFTVTLRDPVNATLATATATATIRDDDDTPGLSVASVSINEGDSGPATVTFTVTLATASNREVTVDYATSDGTATAGSDYTAASGTLTFAAGETTQTIDVTVTGDAIDEPDETFTVTLRDPVNATLATATATATIRDDDDTPGLSVASVSINEGDSGPATVTFTVTLATASNREVTVDYATSDGTATAGSDYTAASGTLTFAAGETTQTIDVTVTGDAIDEPDETFTVTLRDPVNATLATATATATIRDDDDTPGLSVASVSINEGDSGPATVTFTVTLATASNREVTVDYATSDGTATAGSDYTAASGTLTFAAGETTQTIDVTVTGDAIDEPDETFTVTLRDPVNATLATATATATIRDDDDTPGLSVASVSINEGDSGPATVTFTVTLATASNREVTVDYATSDGTATAGSDYTAASGTLTFAAGETTQTIDVTVTGDAIDEPDETFTVTLRDPVNATLATATATATIRDDDDTPGLSVASVSINEGDSGPATVTFTVTLATASNREVTVDYATSDGTATAGSDYTAASGTLTFAAGETTQTIDVTVTGDAIDEPDETFTVTLRDPVNATLATATATATIRDDDDTPGLSVASVSINEGDSGPATVTFTVTLATASNREVTVDYATSDGTATAGSDYTAASGTLTFAAGETTQTIDVTVTGDAIDEPDETFTVTLRDPVNATLATATATATIRDDDDTPGLSVASVSINEGDSGPATVTFTVTLATASNREVTVDYATSDGTATAGSDYTAASGTLTFAAGETTQTIDVTVTGDAIDEPDETFTVTLRDPVNATLATATATATIRDDDDTPGLSVASVSINEGDSGPATVTFTVTLATASNREVTVDYATSDGTATAGSDYTAASGTLTFAAGETTQTIDVTVTGDAIDEPDETFTVTLRDPVNATLATATATATIRDDDDTPGLSVASVSINEGDSGPATVTFTVTLATASNREVTVDYATSDGTATAGSDYTAASGTLTFAAGETTQTIDVTVTGDAIDEPDETFTVTLRDPVNATLATATATATIRDDDDTPGLSVASVSINEGDSGPATVTFTVTLATASNREVTVDYATSDGTATAGSDYTAASGTLTFAAGETTQTIDVTVTGDAIDEPDETFTVTLRDPVNATLATATATATIRDDDDTPGLSVASVSINEGDSGPATVTFTVTLATASNREVTVDYATSDGTATAGSDYTAASGTLTFAAGETTQTIDVTVTGDAIDEPDETFTVTLRDPVNATLATATATATIRDDDDTPGLSVASVSINEGDSGPATVTFTVTLATASNREVTVDYATSDGTATAGSDYTAASGTLTFAAGETTQTIDVTVTGDAIDEPDETFTVTLRDPVNATLATATATATIRDDDDTPGLSVASVSINEGDSGPATVTFTVTLATASNREVTVDYATSDGTATAGSDYTAASGTLTFAAGETTQTIDVTVTGDAIDEPDETFTVTLRDPVNATLATATATATIRDDDDTPGLSVASVSINEGDSGPATVTFTVTLATASNREVTVDYATSDGTATAGSDYTAASGTLTFAAGETTQTIDVTVTGDAIDEPDETFTVTLRDPVNATLATATATATIRDDDDTPGLSVASVSINEGDSGPATVTFTVTLATASNREVTVDYATSDGTATAGSDYTAASGTLTFAAGETTQTIDVTVTGDAIDEPDETFTVTLRDPVNATLATATATATIRDDDDTPGLSVASVSINEGDSGPATVTFTVTLATASNREVTVDYATSDGTATAGSDYTAASGTLTFAAGETTQTIDVTVTGDAIDEPDETFTVTLRDPVNATLATATATATIRDDDDTPGLSVASVSINEGDSGPATVTFTVTLATASNREVTVDYATSDGTATAGSDYTAASGTLTFAAGETTQTIDVTVTGDAIDEPDETFTVTLRDPVNATLATATATATIRDDDDTPGLSVRERLNRVNDAILPEVSRALISNVAGAVASRVEPAACDVRERVTLSILGEPTILRFLQANEKTLNRGSLDVEEILGSSSFTLPLTADDLMFSGAGQYRNLSGRNDVVTWAGDVFGSHVGVDGCITPEVLGGLMLSRSKSTFSYTDQVQGKPAVKGTHKSWMTGIHPYVGWVSPNDLNMWVTAGYSWGDLEINDEQAGLAHSDMRMLMLAFGGNGQLAATDVLVPGGESRLRLKGDAMFGRLDVSGDGTLIDHRTTNTDRLRFVLEGSHEQILSSTASLVSSLELGVRHDSGDGSTGFGLELGPGIKYVDRWSRGLTVAANARRLVANQADLDEWGGDFSILLDPRVDGRGPFFSMAAAYGATSRGIPQLWSQGMTGAIVNSGVHGVRIETEVGYGTELRGGLLTTYGGVSFMDGGARDYRLGSRFTIAPSLDASLEVTQREPASGKAEHGVGLRLQLRW